MLSKGIFIVPFFYIYTIRQPTLLLVGLHTSHFTLLHETFHLVCPPLNLFRPPYFFMLDFNFSVTPYLFIYLFIFLRAFNHVCFTFCVPVFFPTELKFILK